MFTEKELLEKGRKIAEAHQETAQVETEFDSVKAQFKSKLERLSSTIGELSNHMTSGWEYRQVPCETRYDDPSQGHKATYRLDLNEVVEIEQMTTLDKQGELPLTPDTKAGVDSEGNVSVKADK